MHKADSPEFFNFIDNLRNLHSKISSEKPYFLIFTGDFNAHSVQWWPNGDSNNEGTQLNILFSELGLTQLISEPTHFRRNCQPSCIDLIICDQPNLVSDNGVRSSLDQTCKHQITYCKLSLNVNKAHGPDNISGRMIELCGDMITLHLSIIFVNIINTGIFPTLWKSGNVTPIHKKDSKRVINNYRPISILPHSAKIFENILFVKMYNHFTSNNLITKYQSGFRPNDSVTNQLICLVDSIHSSLNINLDVRSVFLYMQKAIDSVA